MELQVKERREAQKVGRIRSVLTDQQSHPFPRKDKLEVIVRNGGASLVSIFYCVEKYYAVRKAAS